MRDVISVAPRPHSRLSPSMLGRVESCTASYFLLPAEEPERVSSEAAAYGTASHEIAERLLRDPAMLDLELMHETVATDGFEFVVDADMLAVIRPYVAYGKALMKTYAATHLERRVRIPPLLTDGLPDVWGHVDLLALDPENDVPVTVVDLKTGRTPVSPKSVQLGLYGLAALNEAGGRDFARTPTPLRTVVIQMRSDGPPVTEHVWTVDEVAHFTERMARLFDELKRRVFRYGVGDHCAFCPVLVSCPAIRAVARDAAMARAVPSPDLLAAGRYGAVDLDDDLALVPVLDKWTKAVVTLAETYLREGGTLNGAKLVRKRTNRRWADDADPRPLLERHGIDPYEEPKLIGPAKAEKLVPKSARDELNKLIVKPEGDLTLAIGEDSRAEVRVAESLRRALESQVAARALKQLPTP